MGDSRGLLDDQAETKNLVGPTTLSSKKLWVVILANLMAFLTYFHASAGATGEIVATIYGHFLTFLFLFNAAYAGINTAQKWALK